MSSRRQILAVLAPCAVCLVLASILFSCGSEDSVEKGENKFKGDPLTATLVTNAEIKRWPKNSAESVFLRWWQSVQYHDAPIGYSLLGPKARAEYTRRRYAKTLPDARFGFDSHPVIEGRAASSDVVTALTVNLEYFRDGRKIGVTPRIMRLQRTPAGWRISDLSYFDDSVAAARKAEASSQ